MTRVRNGNVNYVLKFLWAVQMTDSVWCSLMQRKYSHTVTAHKPDISARAPFFFFCMLKAENLAVIGLYEPSFWMATKSNTKLDKSYRLLHLSCPPLFCYLLFYLSQILHGFVFYICYTFSWDLQSICCLMSVKKKHKSQVIVLHFDDAGRIECSLNELSFINLSTMNTQVQCLSCFLFVGFWLHMCVCVPVWQFVWSHLFECTMFVCLAHVYLRQWRSLCPLDWPNSNRPNTTQPCKCRFVCAEFPASISMIAQ